MTSRKCTHISIPEYFMAVRMFINIRGSLYDLVGWNMFRRLGTQGIYEMVWMGAGDLSLLI